MEVSIVVTVEYTDPDEPEEVEEAPVIADAPESEPPSVDLGTPVALETPVNVEIPPDPETRVAAAMRVTVTTPDFGRKTGVFFVFDSAAITDDQQAMIEEWGDWMKTHPGWALRIEGHTDQQGSCLYNRWLGQQRANAARDILVKRGIDANRLLVVSFGESRPSIPGASRAERRQNRRVRVEPMRPAELETYDPGLPPCAATIRVRSEPSETATAEPIPAAGTSDPSGPGPTEYPMLETIFDAN